MAIVRIEQPYPFPREELRRTLEPYGDAERIWVQEEPANMGVWPYLRYRFGATLLDRPLRGVCRPEAASPATGSAASHKLELCLLLERVFGPLDEVRTARRPWNDDERTTGCRSK